FMSTIIERAQAPTPSFFKKLRNIGLAMAAVSVAIISAPVTLPVIIVNVAGYLAVASGVVSAVSQMAKGKE
ncbi:MAG: hypothetical protein ACRDE2_17965, partial [Chitinophagaceae bacterium]